MIPIFKCWIYHLLILIALTGKAKAQVSGFTDTALEPQHEAFEVIAVEFSGLQRTNREWILSYIDLKLPAKLTREDALILQRRLLTTAVFSEVKIIFSPVKALHPIGKFRLHVDVVERWTTIPVIRGVYGGGTPLRVLGLYDIHTFGRLITIGGEGQKYGDALPGTVLYAKSPQHNAGRYFIGGEIWQEYRNRAIYDNLSQNQSNSQSVATLSTNVKLVRLNYLQSISDSNTKISSHHWRLGAELSLIHERPASISFVKKDVPDLPKKLGIHPLSKYSARILPTLTFDNINLHIIHLDGLRSVLKFGPTFSQSGTSKIDRHSFFELETFWFKLLPSNLNFAAHHVIGRSSQKTTRNQYFLGGLDSVRGFNDGVVFGTHATWLNLEVRHLSWKASTYTWIQSVAFCDGGSASDQWQRLNTRPLASCGLGTRLAIPQVNRLIFRFDYAWDIQSHGRGGFTAGMNQFFDPYKPLSDR